MDISRTGASNPSAQPDVRTPTPAVGERELPAVLASALCQHLPTVPSRFGTASRTEIDAAVEAANTALQQASSSLRFNLDDVSGHIVVKLIDDATNQVVKQFPTEEMLAIARDITRMQQGVLVSEKT